MPIDDDHVAAYWGAQLQLGASVALAVLGLGGVRIAVQWAPADRWWLAAVALAIGLQILALRVPQRWIVHWPYARRTVFFCWAAQLPLLVAFAAHDPAAFTIYPPAAILIVVSSGGLFTPRSMVGLGVLSIVGYLGLAWREPQVDPLLVTGMTTVIALAMGVCAVNASRGRRMAARRRTIERRTEAILQNASDAILTIALDGRITYASPAALLVLGQEPGWLIGRRLDGMAHPEDLPVVREWLADLHGAPAGHTTRIAMRLRRADASWMHAEVIGTNRVNDPDLLGAVLSVRDVSTRRALEEELTLRAFADSLTGLANRALFHDRIEHAVARNRRGAGRITLLLIDIDDFKVVNDGFGHTAGDELLAVLATRLREQVRPADTLARLGGDEFAVLIEDIDELEATALAERVRRAIRQPVALGTREVVCTASIGIATTKAGDGGPGPASEELLRDADLAMYAAKRAGRDRYALFDPAMHIDVLKEAEQRADMERALLAEEFVVFYQPIVDMPSRRLIGVEALVRWQHPQHGLLGPTTFIPLAEATGLIVPLGRWVLEQSCAQLARWHLEHPASVGMRISVNLSARQFQYNGLVEDVAKILASSGIDPRDVVLEITESLLMQDTDATAATLGELKNLGVRLAIDDFGTGYSSLSYLKRFPVDILKIDRSFVDGVTTNAGDATLAEAVVQLGRALQLQTVAEGIETTAQWATLQALGCEYGQGFLFARPVPPDGIAALLDGTGAALGD